ncbi:2-hydroxychromene-2-carboxylate isomerase [Ferrovibrio sp.]|uniref:2-hydroxychromene-2-carboxylate isomerase n=1 Tax=Ferrovibrio sp. TaxID=1917215 RepID=UPI001B6F5749|nr:2-hydroxychromene-2-carboxylate isomerase [Ferrovibrio sp.]MBP7062554.1 2-hydroxychromene-2-carboxylate isomerase [Ferrovibrio sp.]
MTISIDYYTFLGSPWAYLGSRRLEAMLTRHGATARIIPMDAANVFSVSGGLPLAKRAPQRQAYRLVELARWRDFLDVPLTLQPKFFPKPEALPARLVIGLRDAGGPDAGANAIRLAHAVMRAVWAEERDITDDATLDAILAENGFDAAACRAAAESEAVSQAYAQGTEQANAAQVFGAPSYVLDGEIFWGQDRLDFLDRALARRTGK